MCPEMTSLHHTHILFIVRRLQSKAAHVSELQRVFQVHQRLVPCLPFHSLSRTIEACAVVVGFSRYAQERCFMRPTRACRLSDADMSERRGQVERCHRCYVTHARRSSFRTRYDCSSYDRMVLRMVLSIDLYIETWVILDTDFGLDFALVFFQHFVHDVVSDWSLDRAM